LAGSEEGGGSVTGHGRVEVGVVDRFSIRVDNIREEEDLEVETDGVDALELERGEIREMSRSR
jgi:hypothetical protein